MIDLTIRTQSFADNEAIHHVYDDIAIRTSANSEFSLRRAMRTTTDYICVTSDTLLRMKRCIQIGRDAQRVINEPNAGGKSVVSEALSAEYMCRRFGACDIVPEMTIQYTFSNWKKIDYIVTMLDERVGVSVTRAMGYPTPDTFTEQDAERLCYKKLYGLVVARSGISSQFSYNRGILHVFCQTEYIALLMKIAFNELIQKDKELPEDCRLTGYISIILTVCPNVPGIFTEDFDCVS